MFAMSADVAACGAGVSTHQRWLSEVANRPSERVVSVRQDVLRSVRWAVVVDCEHPDWPAKVVLLREGSGVGLVAKVPERHAAPVALPVVRAGARVRVWRRDEVMSLETTGVAEESGEMGRRVRVRLLRQGMNSQDSASYVLGVVRGVGDVEIVQ